MAHLLLVVSRTQPARHTYLSRVFGQESMDVILDRRVGERRRARCGAAAERRRRDRRERDTTGDLQTFGWTLVRHRAK